jgi:hypothetical protein
MRADDIRSEGRARPLRLVVDDPMCLGDCEPIAI